MKEDIFLVSVRTNSMDVLMHFIKNVLIPPTMCSEVKAVIFTTKVYSASLNTGKNALKITDVVEK
jgi:hypothetical protein